MRAQIGSTASLHLETRSVYHFSLPLNEVFIGQWLRLLHRSPRLSVLLLLHVNVHILRMKAPLHDRPWSLVAILSHTP